MKQKFFMSFFVLCGILALCPSTFGAVTGDVDGSENIDLRDAISALQVCAGLKLSVNTDADVNNDFRTGLEEAIFALQVVANSKELGVWYKDADGDRVSDGTTLLSENRPYDHYYEETELIGISGDTDDNNPDVHAALPPEVVVVQSFIKKSDAEWTAAENFVSALSSEEKTTRLGFIPDEIDRIRIRKYTPKHRKRLLPSSFDWRNNNGNFISPVKNQGRCASCWAFAATAALEAQLRIASDSNLDLSEQLVVSCGKVGNCGGGYINRVSDFLRDTGTTSESCYPYTIANGNCNNACSDWRDNAYKTDSWTYVAWHEKAAVSEIKSAIYESGPVVSAFGVYEDFYYYNSGVYSYAWGRYKGGHAILIVGWDDSASAFIVKNSWDTGWGEQGYFRIAYSELEGKTWFGRYTIAYHCNVCAFDISPVSRSFEASGGTGSVKVTASAKCAWNAKSNDSWIIVDSGSGTGNGTISYSVTSCLGADSRTGTMTIAGKTFTVTQPGCEPMTETLIWDDGNWDEKHWD